MEPVLDEWREHQRQHAQKRVTLNGPLLAQFLQQVEQEETFSLQHEREMKSRPFDVLASNHLRSFLVQMRSLPKLPLI